MTTHKTNSFKETMDLGRKLAIKLKPSTVICLYGDLGAGKTVFSKGIAVGLGINERKIKSPTFTLMQKYPLEGLNKVKTLYHFDFYRISEPDDLIESELEEIFQQKDAITVIEWPERVENLLPKKRINVNLQYIGTDQRSLTIQENHD